MRTRFRCHRRRRRGSRRRSSARGHRRRRAQLQRSGRSDLRRLPGRLVPGEALDESDQPDRTPRPRDVSASGPESQSRREVRPEAGARGRRAARRLPLAHRVPTASRPGLARHPAPRLPSAPTALQARAGRLRAERLLLPRALPRPLVDVQPRLRPLETFRAADRPFELFLAIGERAGRARLRQLERILDSLRYVDGAGRVTVVGADTGTVQWRSGRLPPLVAIAWSSDGSRLFAASRSRIRVFGARGGRRAAEDLPISAGRLTALAAGPTQDQRAFVTFDPATGGSRALLADRRDTRVLVAGQGRFTGPGGRPTAGTSSSIGRRPISGSSFPRSVEAGRSQRRTASVFTGETARRMPFPRIEGWCC